MTDEQLTALLAYAGRLDSRVHRSLADPQQAARTIGEWTAVLVDVPATLPDTGWDAARAVRAYYERHGGDRSAQFRAVEPHDLLAAWSPHRAELMNRHTDPLPEADPDNPAAWREELLGSRTDVAHGRRPPAQYRAEINTGGQKRLAAIMSGVGHGPRRYMPEHAARALADYRPRRAAREAAAEAGQPDAYAHKCSWCGAAVDEPCRTGYRRRGKGRAHRATPHPCRTEAATRAAEAEHDHLDHLMRQPPAPRETRARHTSGGGNR